MTDEQARAIAEAAVAWERACATAQAAKQAHLEATLHGPGDQGAIALEALLLAWDARRDAEEEMRRVVRAVRGEGA